MASNVQEPNDQQRETNQIVIESRSSENPESASDGHKKSSEENSRLIETEKEIRNQTSDLLNENMRLLHERNLQEQAFTKYERNPRRIAELIRNRLSYIQDLCNRREKVFEEYMNCFVNRYDETVLSDEERTLIRQKQSELDNLVFTFKEESETIELLLETDYNETCRENPKCFDEVMKECDIVEESCYRLSSIILEQ